MLEKTLESPLNCRKSVLNIHWRDWCWSWNFNTLATWCKELTHLKRPWCWERLKAGGEGDDRGWDGWMASPTQWTWIWVNSGVGDAQGGLTCCSSWSCKESDKTERLNWTIPPNIIFITCLFLWFVTWLKRLNTHKVLSLIFLGLIFTTALQTAEFKCYLIFTHVKTTIA